MSRFIEIPLRGWAYNDTLAYYFNPADSVTEGNIRVSVDYSPSYRFRNLWIEVSTLSEGNISSNIKDTLEIAMVDSAGNPLGTGIASNYQILTDSIPFHLTTGAPVIIRHIMRTDTLRNINRVGLFFNPE